MREENSRVDKLHGTRVPMFVPELGLNKPGQTYVCPQPWTFWIKILHFGLRILHFWEAG